MLASTGLPAWAYVILAVLLGLALLLYIVRR
jgi:hypothetical protein